MASLKVLVMVGNDGRPEVFSGLPSFRLYMLTQGIEEETVKTVEEKMSGEETEWTDEVADTSFYWCPIITTINGED
jgi:hypothetical protein